MSLKINNTWVSNGKLYGSQKVRRSLRGVCDRRFRKADRRLADLRIHEEMVYARQAGRSNPVDEALDNKALVYYLDRGSQYLSIKYTERLVEMHIDLSVGTVGNAYGDA